MSTAAKTRARKERKGSRVLVGQADCERLGLEGRGHACFACRTVRPRPLISPIEWRRTLEREGRGDAINAAAGNDSNPGSAAPALFEPSWR